MPVASRAAGTARNARASWITAAQLATLEAAGLGDLGPLLPRRIEGARQEMDWLPDVTSVAGSLQANFL